ncbi:hypothetical protein LXL04_004304 [Taraxacum kok-saghyz]
MNRIEPWQLPEKLTQVTKPSASPAPASSLFCSTCVGIPCTSDGHICLFRDPKCVAREKPFAGSRLQFRRKPSPNLVFSSEIVQHESRKRRTTVCPPTQEDDDDDDGYPIRQFGFIRILNDLNLVHGYP